MQRCRLIRFLEFLRKIWRYTDGATQELKPLDYIERGLFSNWAPEKLKNDSAVNDERIFCGPSWKKSI